MPTYIDSEIVVKDLIMSSDPSRNVGGNSKLREGGAAREDNINKEKGFAHRRVDKYVAI